MSTPFQNRLVGTIIVAAVVIIFLPDLLDGEKKSHQDDFEAIPKAEVFSGKLTNKPFPEDKLIRQKVTPISNEQAIDEPGIDNSASKPTKQVDQVTKKVSKPAVKPPVKVVSKPKKTLPEKAVAKEAWVIHLGSFKNKDNVAQLLKKLKAKGYIAFTKPIKTKQGTLTKVIIGPELIKTSMVKKLPALKTLTGIQGKVAYFEPNK
ncbi:SPOR domain-containing protein [Colwellia psychrerythraea]|uniref:DedD protein n=1 Tax=Colwellia psychrerythraea (strain 34H / ATCC BAA-681) TaxID=167879 RepID=Q47XK7_COLP3|nr:SPOR domain-containing protein [Colwellia psychrerythraea]AAZ26623.1 dedD protein [Colwellia psychrerythraea 34H]